MSMPSPEPEWNLTPIPEERLADKLYAGEINDYFERTGGVDLTRLRQEEIITVRTFGIVYPPENMAFERGLAEVGPAIVEDGRLLIMRLLEPKTGVLYVQEDQTTSERSLKGSMISLGSMTECPGRPRGKGLYSLHPNFLRLSSGVALDRSAGEFDVQPEEIELWPAQFMGIRISTHAVFGWLN